MSYTTMNPKFKTVENTVVTQSDILYQAQLPSISNRYNILRGRYVFNSSPVGTYALLDDNGGYIRIESGAYIDKVIAYQGTSTTGGVLSSPGSATLNVGMTTLTNGVLDAVTTDGLLSGSLAAATGGAVNKSDPSATTSYSGATGAPIADVQAGSSCHPDILVSTRNYLAVTTGTAAVSGALNVLLFVANP